MPTVYEALLHTMRALDAAWEGTVTSGHVNYLADAALVTAAAFPDNDELNGGTVIITHTTDGLAPLGEVRVVEDYVAASATIYAYVSTGTAFTAAPGAGDRYAVLTDRWPLAQLLAKLNQWLAEYGDVPTIDTSLTTLSATREYTLPDAAKHDLREVWIAQATSQPYDWRRLTSWDVIYAAGGADGKLLFPYQPAVGYKLKLVYLAPHPVVTATTDVLSDYLTADLAGLETALRLVRWRLNQPGDDAEKLTGKLNDLLREVELARRRRRPVLPGITHRLPYFPGS